LTSGRVARQEQPSTFHQVASSEIIPLAGIVPGRFNLLFHGKFRLWGISTEAGSLWTDATCTITAGADLQFAKSLGIGFRQNFWQTINAWF
jgi:hypothetical protein